EHPSRFRQSALATRLLSCSWQVSNGCLEHAVFERIHCHTMIMLCNRSATSDNCIEALRSGRLSAAALDVLDRHRSSAAAASPSADRYSALIFNSLASSAYFSE